jgi:hypothetical protein
MEKYISNIEYLIEKCHSYDGNIWDDADENTLIYKINLDDQFKKFFDYIKDIEYWVKLTKNPKKANTRDLDKLQKILLDKETWLRTKKMDLTAALAFISAHNTEEFYNKMNECFEVNKHTTYPQLVSYIELYKKIKNSKKNIKNIKSRMKKNKKRIEKNLKIIDTLLLDKSPAVISPPSVISPSSVISQSPVISPSSFKRPPSEVFGFESPSMRSRRSSSTVYGFTSGLGEDITVGGKRRITKRRITKHKRSNHKRSNHKQSNYKLSNHKRSTHKRLKHNSNKRTTTRRR